jgi:chromosome segregation protein
LYLREIELENFKSFGRKVRIPFLPGYTAITGPNGSGKSNVSDAVLFVLGPRSSRAIRAGRLTDLIWNGGKGRKGASFTEVSLIFDNGDRVIPIEADEVKLTRRVNLSPSVAGGYNSYFYVNDRRSTQTEFEQLLAHARISAEGYNIVQQGDVQRIVQMSNVERRRILDHIAGITKFDEDIAQAERRRTEVEDNLERIHIILEEIKKQLRELDRDRAGALKYKELKEKLDTAKAQLAYKTRDLILEEIKGTKEQLAKYEAAREKLLATRAKLKEEWEAAGRELDALETRIAERGGEEARQLKVRLDELRLARARAQDTVETSRDEVKRLKAEIRTIERERKRQEKDIAALEADRAKTETALTEAEGALKAVEGELQKLEARASESDERVTALQRDVIALNKAIDDLEERLHGLVLEQDRHREAIERLTAETAQLEETRKTYDLEREDAEFQLQELRAETKDVSKTLRKLQDRYHAKRKEEKTLAAQHADLQSAILTLTREYEHRKAEAAAAEAMQKGYTRAVTAILEARDTGAIQGIHGTIAELARVDAANETAITVAAGNRMQAIVVDDDAVAAKCIEFLRKHRTGRGVFLPLNKMLPVRPRGKAYMAAKEGVGFAIDLVTFDDEYRNAFGYVFGDTVVVKTLEDARRLMGGVRLVTLRGDLVEASGAMSGGLMERGKVRFGGGKGELEKAAAKLRKATEQAERVAAKLEAARTELAELEARIQDLAGRSGQDDVQAKTLEAKRKEFAARGKALAEELAAKGDRLGQLQKTAGRIAEDIERFTERLGKLKEERDEKKRAIVEATPQEIARRMRELMAERATHAEEANGLRAKRDSLETQRKVLADRLEEMISRGESLATQRKDHEKRGASAQDSLVKMAEEIRALERMEASASSEMRELQEARDEAYRRKTRLEGEIDKVAHRIDAREDFHLGLQSTLRVQEEKLAVAEAELAAYEVQVEGSLPTLEALKTTIEETERQIEALGPVNMRALEDYEERQGRHERLSEELGRLESQKKELIQLVLELTQKKKDGLMKVFHAINDNFRRVSEELSEGGEAELVLENEEDPFEGGLIIKAKPPHKKALRLEALSGGEKSLVSMAFIFAIQEYDPSPFYLLDEVDQNLDAVNAEKVARMIRRNAASAQFLQISLRKVTLKEADHILGMTIGRKGVTEVIMKVNLADVEDEKPPQAEAVTA